MNIDFKKSDGLVPVIIQDSLSLQVLMLGYMNETAWRQTQEEGIVTFYSRSRKELWTKGSTSGNYLKIIEVSLDCDNDTILIKASPTGPACHTGSMSCFGDRQDEGFLYQLESVISRKIDHNEVGSYTNELYRKGINKVAQKLGEEAVELVIEAKDNDTDLFQNEAADLLYHFLILLKAKNTKLSEIERILTARHYNK